MSKCTFEFDAEEDRDTIEFINNRYKIMSALEELRDFKRTLYKGYYTSSDYCLAIEDEVEETGWLDETSHKVRKAVKIVTDEDIKKANEAGEPYVKGAKTYLKSDWVESKVDEILDEINYLLSY